jgi:hypothetical protein
MHHGLDTGCSHPKTPKRSCLRQVLRHPTQVGLGGNSHNHSLARQASLLNHAALGPFIPLLAVLANVARCGAPAVGNPVRGPGGGTGGLGQRFEGLPDVHYGEDER